MYRPGVWAGWLALRRGQLHHSRRGRSQPHRPLGRRPVASPGQRDGWIGVNASAPWRLGRMARSTPGAGFTTAGGVAANNIARWDGAQWHPLGSGMNGFVSTPWRWPGWLALRRGRFTTAGGVAANRIARWDGAQWHPLGSGMNGGRICPGVWAGWLALRRGLCYNAHNPCRICCSPVGGAPWPTWPTPTALIACCNSAWTATSPARRTARPSPRSSSCSSPPRTRRSPARCPPPSSR
jgi:hypothetical protein